MNATWLDGEGVKVASVKCAGEGGPTPREVEGVNAFELCLVREGCFRVRGHRLEAFADPATCLLGSPGHVVEVAHPRPGGDVTTFVSVSAEVLASFGGGVTEVPAIVPATAEIVWAHQQLVASARRDADAMTVEEWALLLFALALGQAEPGRVQAGMPSGRAHQQLADDARAALSADPSIASVVELARLIGCSPNHLSRVFTKQTGLSVSHYRSMLRLNRALTQIAEGATNLAHVAATCGFADHAHLTRTVRQHLETTPSALRAALRTGSSMDVQAAISRVRQPERIPDRDRPASGSGQLR